MSTRFTAVIKIIKVEVVPGTRDRGVKDPDTSKDTELANIVVRNTHLENLLEKVKGHLDLVEE